MPSNHPWVPKPVETQSITNRSGGVHNIITNENLSKLHSGKSLVLLEKQDTNRKKGVTEFRDLMRGTALNPGWDYLGAVESNPYNFRRKNGVFTNMYDSAARFGETEVFKA